MKKTVYLTVFLFLIVLNSFTGLAAAVFPPDINGHVYESAVKFVYNRGIVEGYPDGTYKPDQTLNRAELLKIIVGSKFSASEYNPYEGDACFDDVDGTQWYTKYVCFAKAEGIVEGYPDGTFKPSNNVNFVEALKIMMEGMGVAPSSTASGEWFMPYYDSAAAHYLIPSELTGEYSHNFSRGQAAEVIMRILSLDAAVVQPAIYSTGGGYEPGNLYIGYIQWDNALDLYLIADGGISEYLQRGQTLYIISGNKVLSFDLASDFPNSFTAGSVTISGGFTLHTNEIMHIGTAYLETANPATVNSDVL